MAAPNMETVVSLIKARLNRATADTSLDDYLMKRARAARDELERIGITLDDSNGDTLLLVDFAVWQYQNRDKPGSMPDWLRLRRRERWLQQ